MKGIVKIEMNPVEHLALETIINALRDLCMDDTEDALFNIMFGDDNSFYSFGDLAEFLRTILNFSTISA